MTRIYENPLKSLSLKWGSVCPDSSEFPGARGDRRAELSKVFCPFVPWIRYAQLPWPIAVHRLSESPQLVEADLPNLFNAMKRLAVLFSIVVFGIGWAGQSNSTAPSEKQSEVAIAIHDSHGVSFESAWDGIAEVILFGHHNHIHLKISNVSAKPLTLWRPSCPDGDHAMKIEFREPGEPNKVYRSGIQQGYTAGMGFPKVFELAAGGDLIVNVDFLAGYWTLPIGLSDGESREVEVRAVYHSADKPMMPVGDKNVRAWSGKAMSPWHKMRLINRTGKAVVADRRVK